MILKKLLQVDQAHSPKVEKKYILYFCCISILFSLIVNLFLRYNNFLGAALFQKAFYQSLLAGIFLLCMLPFCIAYVLGRLLSLISYFTNDQQSYGTQYNLLWLLFLFFAYFFVESALKTNQELGRLNNQCMKGLTTSSSCSTKAIQRYSAILLCGRGSDQEKIDCISKALK